MKKKHVNTGGNAIIINNFEKRLRRVNVILTTSKVDTPLPINIEFHHELTGAVKLTESQIYKKITNKILTHLGNKKNLIKYNYILQKMPAMITWATLSVLFEQYLNGLESNLKHSFISH